ncbi:putative colon cancer-associated protein Mic1 [Oesophagostomum dentatum]|uniref:Putative colon cancer-associated protein Mic1 n=1 Tax=Oesophagostomum dentatum TaxID=61180 RepID=A0A0B1TML0_OESDE|nr:putative colon cancer-associated protein Mic1 [Oesophagostomum dentatum]
MTAAPHSATYQFEDEELNAITPTGISCDRLRQALKKCIKESHCVQICTVRNNGSLGITAKSLAVNDVISARTKDRGPPGLMKLSPNGKLAILQRQMNSIDVILLEKNDGNTAIEFNVATKSRDMILSVDWITNNQVSVILFSTISVVLMHAEAAQESSTTQISLHSFCDQTIPRTICCERRQKNSKSVTNVEMYPLLGLYITYAKSNLIIIATGNNCTTLQPFLIQHGQFTRLKSFDVDSGTPSNENLLEKDVTVTSIYGKVCVMVLRYSVRGATTTDLLVYELSSDPNTPTKMKYSLALGCSGGFGIHVIDNLVVVHHQGIAKSMIFDVALSPNRPTHSPLMTVSIKPSPVCQPPPALYIPLWSMFQPDIVVGITVFLRICRFPREAVHILDPVAGMMYQLTVCCNRAHEEIHEKAMLIEFLIHRTGQKQLVLDSLLNSLKAKELRLRQIRKLFDLIVEKFSLSTASQNNVAESTKPQLEPIPVQHLRIEQQEMQSSIFIPMMEDQLADSKYVADVMLQYLRSLHRWSVPVEVISDSKPLAFLLLSYEARCPSLFQSGVDILARQKACDEIVEVLLERGHVIDAMRYLDTQQIEANSLKLLDAAKQENRVVQYAVLNHIINRKSKEDVSKLQSQIDSLFSEEEVEEATEEVAKAIQFT